MKHINRLVRQSFFLALAGIIILSSCNKDPEQIQGPPPPPAPTGLLLGESLTANPDYSLYLAVVNRAGLLATINNPLSDYTLFVPGNAAVKAFVNAASGGLVPLASPDEVFLGFINTSLPVENAVAVVSYNTVPQKVTTADIPADFPNLQYPSIFNPEPDLSDLLRLTTFPSVINGKWVNNIPLTTVDVAALNGIIHTTAAVVVPPQRFLWDRIDTDPNLTYLKAAIIRADSGIVAPTDPSAVPTTLKGALQSIGANLTVFAPTDVAFQATLTGAIYQALLPVITAQLTAAYIAGGMSPDDAAALAAVNAPPIALSTATGYASTTAVFDNPALQGVLTAEMVKGIVVYHILGTRAFTNNFPTTEKLFQTLLNQGIPTHPGVGIEAAFGVPFVSSATVKGAANATAANVIINALPLIPEPFGTSDQHYVNGVLHEIDQVLLPQ